MSQTVPQGAELRRRPTPGPPEPEVVAVRGRLLAQGSLARLAMPAPVAAKGRPPELQVVVGTIPVGGVIVRADAVPAPFLPSAAVARVAVPPHASPPVGLPRPLAHDAADGRVAVAAPRVAVSRAAKATPEAAAQVAVVGRQPEAPEEDAGATPSMGDTHDPKTTETPSPFARPVGVGPEAGPRRRLRAGPTAPPLAASAAHRTLGHPSEGVKRPPSSPKRFKT